MLNLLQGMVSIFLSQLLQSGRIHVKGDLRRLRDFIHIDDVVAAFIRCLDSEDAIAREIDIGTGQSTTVEELIRLMVRTRQDAQVIVDGTTPGDIAGIFADTRLAETALGFTAQVGLEEGLERMIDWAEAEHEARPD